MTRWLAVIVLLVGSVAGCHHDTCCARLGPRALYETVQIPELPEPPPRVARADAKLQRRGRTSVRGHVLTIPPSFSSADGAYDLVVHFHGNPDAVEESYRRADINAVVVIVNLGAGATRYIERYADPSRLERLLRGVDGKLAQRGLVHPHRRRLALSAWSAGYGAILRVLDHPQTAPLVDAVLLLDALHARRMPVTGGIDRQDLAPFAAFAARAAAGHALLVITHSEIEPEGPIVSVDDCSNYLLAQLGIERHPACGRVPPTPLEAAHEFYAPHSLVPLELETVARRGGLIVRAYEGRSPEHHIAHLFQMGTLVLDDLQRWWSDPVSAMPAA